MRNPPVKRLKLLHLSLMIGTSDAYNDGLSTDIQEN